MAQKLVQTQVTFFIFETPKAKIILETSLYKNHFYFEFQVFTVYFRSTCVYTSIKTDNISGTCCIFQLTGNCQLLPST